MTEENNFVAGMQCIQVTPAQKSLLDYLNPRDIVDMVGHLKEVHELGTYFIAEQDLVNLEASLHVQWLLERLQDMMLEVKR